MIRRHGLMAALALGAALCGQPTAAVAAVVPQVAGHRGATGVAGYPEQSLKAMGYAATYGAAIVEGDVEFTSDDYAVMIHDKTLDRTTDCTGKVADKTFAEIRECAPHTVVPQLLFWLREAKRLGLTANVEIRNGITAHQVEVFARTINQEAPDETVVASWYPQPLADAKAALGTRVKYAPIIGPTGSPFGYSVADHAANYDIVMPDYRWMIVDRMHWYADAGMPVWLWTADTDAAITRCKALANAEPATSVIIANDVRKITAPAIAAGVKAKAKR